MEKFDVSEGDFNPVIFYASKSKIKVNGQNHNHDYTEVTYILSGKGKYLVDGILYQVQAGDVIICNPGIMHQNFLNDDNEPMTEFVTGFTDFHFSGMPLNHIILEHGGWFLRTSVETRQKITKHCYEMVEEQEGNSPGRYFMMKAQLMELLIVILRETKPLCELQKSCKFESYHKNYVVKKMIAYFSENFANRISLDQVAQNMYLSPVYISKLFKEEIGDSPINYLIKIRLEKAKEILEQSDQTSIKNVAKQVGYEDVYHFSKLFKKHYGISPLHYRKNFME